MAGSKPIGDKERNGAVRKRSHIKIKLIGNDAWVKRNRNGGKLMAMKKPNKKFKGVRRATKAA
jgi:hypothetical protein